MIAGKQGTLALETAAEHSKLAPETAGKQRTLAPATAERLQGSRDCRKHNMLAPKETAVRTAA